MRLHPQFGETIHKTQAVRCAKVVPDTKKMCQMLLALSACVALLTAPSGTLTKHFSQLMLSKCSTVELAWPVAPSTHTHTHPSDCSWWAVRRSPVGGRCGARRQDHRRHHRRRPRRVRQGLWLRRHNRPVDSVGDTGFTLARGVKFVWEELQFT